MSQNSFFRNALLATPLYILSIVPFVALADYFDYSVDAGYAALGALGWWVALLVRVPFIVLIRKRSASTANSGKFIVALSGPAEELVRLAILLTIGLSVENAYSVGIGWGFIEIFYGLLQMFGLASLNNKTDKKSVEAKEMMSDMGMDRLLDENTPFWGALERLSATALHISFSLALVLSPWLIVLTIPIHSGFNFMVLAINKSSIARSQFLFFTCSTVLLASSIFFNLQS